MVNLPAHRIKRGAAAFAWLAAVVVLASLETLAPQAQAQGGVPLWTNRFNGPANASDYPTAIAVDRSGNIFVTGSSSGNGSASDYATVKYSGAGTPLWTNRYKGPGNDYDFALALTVDGGGDVFVTGQSDGVDGFDYATIKYSSAGVPLWTNRYGGLGRNESARAIGVDQNGNVFVAGDSDGSGFCCDFVMLAYSSTGAPLWTNRYDNPGRSPSYTSDHVVAMAVDGGGNLFVIGSSVGDRGDSDFVTLAYSSAGVALWTNRYDGPGQTNDYASAIAVDSKGDVFVTGASSGAGGDYDFATVAYSGAGAPLWTNRFAAPGDTIAYKNAIAVDRSGNVFVIASATGTNGLRDYGTVAYSGAGLPRWTNRYNGPGNKDDYPYAVAVDSSGNVFVTGFSTATNGLSDFATVAYSGSGVPLWTNRHNGPGNNVDYARALTVDNSGDVIVTGYSTGSGSGADYATIKYSSSVRPIYLALDRDGSNGYFIRFTGAPDVAYRLQRAADVTGPWDTLATLTAPASGAVEYHDDPSPGQAFYRTVQP